MCGIAGGVGLGVARVEAGIRALRHRGPDGEAMHAEGDRVIAHARLAIQDPTPASAQPFMRGRVVLVYNGELWNAPTLRDELVALGERFGTTGDTEVVAAALDRWGVDALPRLDGMFAMAWLRDGEAWIARDRFGEVPLHWSPAERAFASEAKAMRAMNVKGWRWLEPGTMARVDARNPKAVAWHTIDASSIEVDPDVAATRVRDAIALGSRNRTVSDVPLCALLSGGIDSSIIALHARAVARVAYIAVLDPRSRDLRCARVVAERIGLELREVRVEPPTADALAEVVRVIEIPHKAQVEIGYACLTLARRMREDGFKVCLSGEGSDELWASYGLSYHGIVKDGWHAYRRRLFVDQHRKNFARCNKAFMAHGVECRLPFLQPELVELALSLPRDAVVDGSNAKGVLARAHRGLLPDDVLDRPKLAFQDGMKLKDACADAVADPRRFYALEHARQYGGVPP